MRALLHRYLDDELLARSVLGATVEEWLLLVAALVVTALLMLGARALIHWRIRRTSDRETLWVEQVITNVLVRTRGYFLFALALYLAARITGWDERGLAWTAGLLTLAALLQSGRWITGLITLWMERYKAEKLEADAAAVTSMQAVSFLSRLVVWAVIGLMLLDNLGIDVTALVAGLGIGGIAIGLAVQNILGDLFASLSIVLDKPFVIGDTLAVGTDFGTVEHIGLKSTRLRSLSGEQIVFSNGDLLASRVRNYRRMVERRVVFTFGVTYDTPHATLQAIPGLVRDAVEREAPDLPRLRFDRAHFKAFGDSSLDFEVVYHVLDSDYGRYMDAQQAINLGLVAAFEERGIDFAFPTRTLHIATAEIATAETAGRRLTPVTGPSDAPATSAP
ncbi:MAG: mechanosensitive ion channel family protein [Rhodothermales bacterium]